MNPEPNASFNYVVTAYPPTAVLTSVVGNFTSATDLNLIVGKATRIQIHTSTATGLEALLDVPLYGRISSLFLMRAQGAVKDSLFILVERLRFCILDYDPDTKELVTKAQGDLQDVVGRPSDAGQLSLLDPEGRMVGLQLYEGMLKIIPLDKQGRVSEAFNVRLDELSVLDCALLAGAPSPLLVVLFSDQYGAPHLSLYEVQLKEKELAKISFKHSKLDSHASKLIPIPAPLGGFVVLGRGVISYMTVEGGQDPCAVGIQPAIMHSWGFIESDGTRMLLSDQQGLLYLLVLIHSNGKVTELKTEIVGRTSAASSLSYLDNGVVFIGSRQGDSQLVRLHPEAPNPSDPDNYVEVVENFPNLGPIVDFCVVDLDHQGQGQIVTCSGAMSDGTLRVVRNGIGINVHATVDLPGIKGVWSLRPRWKEAHDKYLVLTFVGETRLLAINQEDELEEAEIPGLSASSLTLWCGNTKEDHLIQVTSSSVRLINCDTEQLAKEWKPANGSSILMASGNPAQVVVATGGGSLHLLASLSGDLKEVGHVTLSSEVACMDITPLDPCSSEASLIAVGTWDKDMVLVKIHDNTALSILSTEALIGEVIPRSVLMARLEGSCYLMVGMGDGQLHHWRLDPFTGAVTERKKMALGTKPIQLRPFNTTPPASSAPSASQIPTESAQGDNVAQPMDTDTTDAVPTVSNGHGRESSAASPSPSAVDVGCSVFAASDRPMVIHSSNRKLMFSNLNESEVQQLASFNSASFPGSIVLVKEDSLTIGGVDKLQKLHIRSVPLHEQARRITHQESTRTFGVLTITNAGMTNEQCSVKIIDDSTFDLLDTYKLDPYELCSSICSCTLGDDSKPYYVVASAWAPPRESECKLGRVQVMSYADGELKVVAEAKVDGAVYDAMPFQDGKLIVAHGKKVSVYTLSHAGSGGRKLSVECTCTKGGVTSLYLSVRGDHVLVGDLMRSVSLYLYKPETQILELRAQDYASNWTSAVAMLDDDNYLAAENSNNMYVVRKNPDAAADEDRQKLEVVGEYHVGGFINRIRPGSLVMKVPDSQLANLPTFLFGTIDGMIGLIANLPLPLFDLLNQLQEALRSVVHGVGGLHHQDWRSWRNERKVSEPKGFIDGDLIETLLDLPQPVVQKVISSLRGEHTFEQVMTIVEELARLH